MTRVCSFSRNGGSEAPETLEGDPMPGREGEKEGGKGEWEGRGEKGRE